MNENTGTLYVVVAIIVLVGVGLALVVGGIAGGVVGYFVGREQARAVLHQMEHEHEMFEEHHRIPMPELPEEMPPLLPEEEMPFPEGPINGALITEVIEGSPAQDAGLREGDIILAVDGQQVNDDRPLERLIRRRRPGERVEITLWRDGREATTQVRLTEHPDERGITFLGIFFRPVHFEFE